MNRIMISLGIMAALLLGAIQPLSAGRVFTDPKTGKTVIELKVDGLPNAVGTNVNNRANVAVVKSLSLIHI